MLVTVRGNRMKTTKKWRKNESLCSFPFLPALAKKLDMYTYACQPFYIYRLDILYVKSAKNFCRGPIISEDVLKTSKDVTESSV